jgi:hypothetical protein
MSDASDEANRWSWMTPDGRTVTGAKGELMLALRGERLPASTLVSRPGWAEWLPASRVAELRNVLPPGKAEAAQAPKLAAGNNLALPTLRGHPGPANAVQAHAVQTASKPPPPPVRGGTSRPPPPPVRQPKPLAAPAPSVAAAKPQVAPAPSVAAAKPQVAPAPSVAAAKPQVVPAPTVAVAKPQVAPPPSVAAAKPLPAQPKEAAPTVPATWVDVPLDAPGLRPPNAAAAGPETVPRGVSVLGPRREELVNSAPARAPLPTLGDDEAEQRMATLRPPGAVPPPPRIGVGALIGTPTPKVAEEALTEREVPLPSSAVPTTVMNKPPAANDRSAHGVFAPAREPGRELDSTLGSSSFDGQSQRELPLPKSTRAGSAKSGEPEEDGEALSWTLPLPRSVVIVLALFLSGVLLLGGAAFVFPKRSNVKTAASADTSAAPPPAAVAGCRLLAPAARLATTVERSVQPSLAEIVNGERVAVGFAAAPKVGAGAIIRLETLDAERRPDQNGDATVRSSAPLVKNGTASFVVDRTGGELGGARTLPDGTTVGFAGADLVERSRGKSSVLVAGAASEKTTDPRVAAGSAATLVTFRRGGMSGQVLYTWMGPEATVSTSLTPVAVADVKFSGTPDAAANGAGGLIAFAGRASESDEWRVKLVKVPLRGQASAQTFTPPPRGSGGGNIAPAVAALGDSDWLLQWTEGKTGAYEVRLQRLNAKLEPVGEARLVSPKGANAGQGAVIATGSNVLSVYIQTTAGHDELWGASFECR